MRVIFIASTAVSAVVAAVIVRLVCKIVTAMMDDSVKCRAEFEQRHKEFEEQQNRVKDDIEKVKERRNTENDNRRFG